MVCYWLNKLMIAALCIFCLGIICGCEVLMDELGDEMQQELEKVVTEIIDEAKEDAKERIDEVLPIQPKPSEGKIETAIAWAEGWEGVENAYICECHRFVCDAYTYAGIDIEGYKGSALDVLDKHEGSLYKKTPPPGAMILYVLKSNRDTPHTALSLGGGKMIHNNTHRCPSDNDPGYSIVEIEDYKPSYLIYIGWVSLVD